jgi:outer membrane protein OmpA-like peptidoglycan-associated protein
MQKNPTLEIEIRGHICCKLHSEDGMDIDTRTYSLSLNRAKHIRDQLVEAGISTERMKYIGFAGTKPLIEPELTADDRNRNRRVEIKILKK